MWIALFECLVGILQPAYTESLRPFSSWYPERHHRIIIAESSKSAVVPLSAGTLLEITLAMGFILNRIAACRGQAHVGGLKPLKNVIPSGSSYVICEPLV